MKELTIDGLNVKYFDEADGKEIIFIHAFPMCNRMWNEQVEFFKSKNKIVVYDLRGFGYSEVGDGQFTIETHVDDLMMIIDKLEISSPVICGLSMGGYISLRALERYQNKFKAVILSDTRSEADNNTAKINRSYQIKQIHNGETENFFDNFIKKALSKNTINTNIEVVKFINEMIRWQTPKGIIAGLLALGCRTDTTEFLPKINIPALIIVGEEDKLTPPEFAKDLHCKISGSRLEIISNAGHFPNMENAKEFNRVVNNFIEELT